jgi:hypothetical protein
MIRVTAGLASFVMVGTTPTKEATTKEECDGCANHHMRNRQVRAGGGPGGAEGDGVTGVVLGA